MYKETKLLIVSILIATLSFIVALYFQKIWLALFLALITAIIFLTRIVIRSKSEFETKSSYRFFYGLISLMILVNGVSFVHDYGNRNYQKNLLLDIRKTIDQGITKTDIQEKLIYVLRVYHEEDRESIVETFQELIPERFSENGIYLSDFDISEANRSDSDIDDNLNHFYEIDNERDEIRLYVVADVSVGQDTNYKNYDGQIGQFEMLLVLNQEGVDYEILN